MGKVGLEPDPFRLSIRVFIEQLRTSQFHSCSRLAQSKDYFIVLWYYDGLRCHFTVSSTRPIKGSHSLVTANICTFGGRNFNSLSVCLCLAPSSWHFTVL
jgi:hypothetical protein